MNPTVWGARLAESFRTLASSRACLDSAGLTGPWNSAVMIHFNSNTPPWQYHRANKLPGGFESLPTVLPHSNPHRAICIFPPSFNFEPPHPDKPAFQPRRPALLTFETIHPLFYSSLTAVEGFRIQVKTRTIGCWALWWYPSRPWEVRPVLVLTSKFEFLAAGLSRLLNHVLQLRTPSPGASARTPERWSRWLSLVRPFSRRSQRERSRRL